MHSLTFSHDAAHPLLFCRFHGQIFIFSFFDKKKKEKKVPKRNSLIKTTAATFSHSQSSSLPLAPAVPAHKPTGLCETVRLFVGEFNYAVRQLFFFFNSFFFVFFVFFLLNLFSSSTVLGHDLKLSKSAIAVSSVMLSGATARHSKNSARRQGMTLIFFVLRKKY